MLAFQIVFVLLAVFSVVTFANEEVTSKVYFDISIGGKDMGNEICHRV